MEVLEGIEDTRRDRSVMYPLHEVLIIMLLAVICGATSYAKVEMFGKSKKEWLSKFLKLEYGIPDACTFRNVIKEIDSISISELNNMQQDSLIEVKRVFNSRFNELESYKRQFLRNNDNEMVINIENIQDELEKLYEQCLKIKPLISPSVAYQKTKQILDDLYEKNDNCYVKNDSNK